MFTQSRAAGPREDIYLHARSVGPLKFWKIEDCERQASDLAQVLPPEGSPDFVKIVLQLAGEVTVEKRGRKVTLRPGTIGFYGLSRNCDRLSVQRGSEQLVGIVPRRELASRSPGFLRIMQRQLPLESPTCTLAFNFLTELYESANGFGAVRLDVANVAIHLLQVAVAEQAAASDGRSSDEKVRSRIIGYVDLHLHDPDLSVESIARAMRCSSRYLQKVFGSPESLGRYIWRTRIERCRAALEDPGNAGISLTEIAFSLGFSNASHFSRVFRDRFGMSPSEWRAASLH